jgi:hypothetical protein
MKTRPLIITNSSKGLNRDMKFVILTILRRCARPIAICDPLRDSLVPLFLRLSVKQSNDDHGHVVAPDSASVAARGQAVVHQVLADAMQILLRGNSSSDKLDDRL